ncbi:hypothetical protein DFH06DRAFT_1092805 [Mycena polygramma]|nr:hypothetical protein DFH06DRAFT_1092805 [Mycena polygramma]
MELDRFIAHTNQTGVVVIGEKPDPASRNEPDTFLISIPRDRLSIRLFPGGTRPQSGMFFFDFFAAHRQVAVNSPQGYTVTIVWPHALAGPLASLEVTMGMTPNEGVEKFTVTQNVRCSLARPHQEAYLFDIPARTLEARVGQAIPY